DLPRRRRSGHEEGLYLPGRRERQVKRRRGSGRDEFRRRRGARGTHRDGRRERREADGEVLRGGDALPRQRPLPFAPGDAGVARGNSGVPQRPDAIVGCRPSPGDRPFKSVTKDGADAALSADDKAPLSAFVWKTVADPFAGRITMFRVISGTMKADSTVHNRS